MLESCDARPDSESPLPPTVMARSTVGDTVIATSRHTSHFEVAVFVQGQLTVVHQRYSLAAAMATHEAEATRANRP